MWPSKRLDFSPGDWLYAAISCLTPHGADLADRVETRWAAEGDGVVALSVRTLFDLYLQAAGWARGDRIVFTAITVGDMPAIARAHGLEVASIDIDPETTEPDPEALAALLTPRTRALVFTHLYGARVNVEPAIELARARGIRFVEDCAEAYAGPRWRGHRDADVALFSFGPIKTATAFGGGLARVADPALRARMRQLAAAYPEQTRAAYLGRLLKYGALGVAGIPSVFGVLVAALRAIGVHHDALLQRLTRGFPGAELLPQIRRRPSAPLLRLLERRLGGMERPVQRRVAPGERLVHALAGLRVPTAAARPHGYWLVPVISSDPARLVERLDRAGFNATRGRAFAVVESDPGVGAPPPANARMLHERIVFLPFSPEMPPETLERLAALVIAIEAE